MEKECEKLWKLVEPKLVSHARYQLLREHSDGFLGTDDTEITTMIKEKWMEDYQKKKLSELQEEIVSKSNVLKKEVLMHKKVMERRHDWDKYEAHMKQRFQESEKSSKQPTTDQ